MTERKKLSKGLLIAIEGIDGAGKTSQARLLCEALSREGYDAIYLREPTDGTYGRKIRALAIEGRHNITPFEEFELFLKDRRQDVEENIRPALDAGKIVVIDRYFYSSIAYQGALGLDPEFINSENRKIAITPDLMIYLSIPAEYSTHRIEKSRGDTVNLFEKMEYLEKVKAVFDSMKYPEVWKVNGEKSVEEIHKTILGKVKELIDHPEPEGIKRSL
jgi:dTMP kinase